MKRLLLFSALLFHLPLMAQSPPPYIQFLNEQGRKIQFLKEKMENYQEFYHEQKELLEKQSLQQWSVVILAAMGGVAAVVAGIGKIKEEVDKRFEESIEKRIKEKKEFLIKIVNDASSKKIIKQKTRLLVISDDKGINDEMWRFFKNYGFNLKKIDYRNIHSKPDTKKYDCLFFNDHKDTLEKERVLVWIDQARENQAFMYYYPHAGRKIDIPRTYKNYSNSMVTLYSNIMDLLMHRSKMEK